MYRGNRSFLHKGSIVPAIEMSQSLPCTITALFDFLVRPAHLLRISPPDLKLELVEAPQLLALGARLTVRGRRWGIPQIVTSEVVEFEHEELIVEKQVRGPLRYFRHERRLKKTADGVLLSEGLQFEPPGGLIGLMMTAERIEKELRPLLAYRQKRLAELFASKDR